MSTDEKKAPDSQLKDEELEEVMGGVWREDGGCIPDPPWPPRTDPQPGVPEAR